MFVTCGTWCLADVLSISPTSEQTVCSDEGLTLDTSAKHVLFCLKIFFFMMIFFSRLTEIHVIAQKSTSIFQYS